MESGTAPLLKFPFATAFAMAQHPAPSFPKDLKLMRTLISALLISASLAAQYTGEPPYLYGTPALDTRFTGAALGGVGAVAQIQFTPMRDAAGNLVPNEFYVTATLINGNFYVPHAAIWNAQTGVITPRAADVAALVGAQDGFALNVSNDLKVCVFDNAVRAVVARRANSSLPFGSVTAIGAPVPPGYVDSSLFDPDPAFAPNGYQYAYISGLGIRYATIDITTGAVLSAETQVELEPVQAHSHMPMRQQVGSIFDLGKTRAICFSKNDSSADAYFRSSIADRGVLPVPIFRLYDDASWKANPGHHGGDVYYAYAPGNAYGAPLRHRTLSCSSAHVPPGGGLATIVGWSKPRAAAPIFGTIVLGAAGLAPTGIDLSFMGVAGKLGLNPSSLIVLPLQVFDFAQGEIGYDLAVNIPRPTTIHYQVLSFDTANSSIALGNTAQLDVR